MIDNNVAAVAIDRAIENQLNKKNFKNKFPETKNITSNKSHNDFGTKQVVRSTILISTICFDLVRLGKSRSFFST